MSRASLDFRFLNWQITLAARIISAVRLKYAVKYSQPSLVILFVALMCGGHFERVFREFWFEREDQAIHFAHLLRLEKEENVLDEIPF